MITVVSFSGDASRWKPRNSPMAALALAAAMLAGCGATAKPQISPIEFTSAGGAEISAVTSLAVNGQVDLVATVTHDNRFLGVSWTVSCGSAAPPSTGTIDTSCGTFNPVQTESGPIPTYPSTGIITTFTAPPEIPKGASVTITAHATSLPSVTSSVVVTIVAAKSGSSADMAHGKGAKGTPAAEAAGI